MTRPGEPPVRLLRQAGPWLGWAALVGGTTLALGRSELFRTVSYELGFVVAALVSMAALHLAPLTYRRWRRAHGPARTADEAIRLFFDLVWKALWPVLLLVLEAANIAWALGAGDGCQTLVGLAFFGLTAGGAALVATLVGLAAALTFRRTAAAVAAGESLLLLTWLRGLVVFYSNPPVCVFDPFVGYFSGNLYDALLVLHPGLVWSRVQDLAAALGLASLAALLGRPSPLRILLPPPRRRVLLAVPVGLLATAALLHGLHGRLGFTLARKDLLARLSGRVETPHFMVAYDPAAIHETDARLVAEDAEFRYSQLAHFFDTRPKGKITVYLFASRLAKKRLLGAHQVEMAKPWRREVYVTKARFPHPVLKHELAHVFAGTFGDPVFGVAFRWHWWHGLVPIPMFNPGLIEGAAVAADWRPSDLTPHQRAKALRKLGWRVGPKQVMTYGFFGSAAVRSYSVAGSFCRFLIDRYGMARFRRLYRTGGDFQAVYGKDLAGLAAEWEAFLEGVPLSADDLARARALLRGRSVFRARCLHKVAALLHRAADASPEEAIRLYEQVCRLDETSEDALWGLMEAHLALGNFPAALASARRLLAHPATNRTAQALLLLELGDAYWKAGDRGLATRFFSRALELADTPYTHRAAGVRLSALRFPDTAAAVRALLLEGSPEAVGKLNLALRRHPTWVTGYYLLGSWFLAKGQPGPAADFLRRSLLGKLPNEWVRWEAAIRLGRAYYLTGRFERAARLFGRLAEVAPPRIKSLARDWKARCEWASTEGWKIVSQLREN